jgi:hypothetical protein
MTDNATELGALRSIALNESYKLHDKTPQQKDME